jgi:hypothetical protein
MNSYDLDKPETATPPKPTTPARRSRKPKAASATPARVKAPPTEQDVAAAKERAQAKSDFKAALKAIATKQASAQLLATGLKRAARMTESDRRQFVALVSKTLEPELPLN